MAIKPPPVWVTPHEQGWQVKREGASRASAVTNTQEKAVRIADRIAENERTERYLTNRHGQIRERNSHGHDPRSRKG